MPIIVEAFAYCDCGWDRWFCSEYRAQQALREHREGGCNSKEYGEEHSAGCLRGPSCDANPCASLRNSKEVEHRV